MKLAEALILRSDIKVRLSMLEDRLNDSARVQEGTQPLEDPATLLEELDDLSQQLESLISKINFTNSNTLAGEQSLAQLLARRETLGIKTRLLTQFAKTASDLTSRYSKSEILIQPTMNVSEIRKHIDTLSKQLRETDTKIQELNWTTDLIE